MPDALTGQSFAVVNVERGAPDAVIGIAPNGPGSYQRIVCKAVSYQPQVGDNVMIGFVKSAAFFVCCLTEGRTWVPSTLQLAISSTAPVDGSQQVTTTYVRGGLITAVVSPVTPGTGGSVQPIRPQSSRSYDPTNGWNPTPSQVAPQELRQGAVAGLGGASGLWFYGPGAFAALTGHAGFAGTVHLTRANRGGTPSGPKPIQLALHAHATQPTGAPTILATHTAEVQLARNQAADLTIPADWLSMLVAGSAAGLGISSGSTADYLICQGIDEDPASGVLTVTYTS